MYNILKNILFKLDPETAHRLSLNALQCLHRCKLMHAFVSSKPFSKPCQVMGLSFPNPIGLAAGLDKNGEFIAALGTLGFGFIEIGTLTPKPQAGNPSPRLFRLIKEQALINRMGFNNKGIEHAVKTLEKTHYNGILGINIGKNKDTPLERAADDYMIGFRELWKFAHYMTINVSSPNTAGLRDLQQRDALTELLHLLKKEQARITKQHNKYVPLVVKISPDLSTDELAEMAEVFLQQHIDGIIATNTTLDRQHVKDSVYANEAGGLSGKPLQARSTAALQQLHTFIQGRIPLIASGGVMDIQSAQAKIDAGAKLVQVYTGLIYAGPSLLNELARIKL